ncbi:MAG: aldehyde dehydrogenase family protein, partial [Candidatus Dormibacteraeota bacterium]|nr:aldehyde dehydrogenase family protein [Candidatus Dormibacteraeota bacterium]
MAIVSINPATEEQLASFEEHTWEQVDAALQRAHETHHAWRDAGFSARAARFTELAAHLRAEKGRLAGLLTAEMGKP